MVGKKLIIQKRYIILCEGIDTLNFIIWYLNSNALSNDDRFSNDIQVFDFGGIDNLENFILNLKNMENFDEVNRILIVRDAETNVDSAVNMVKKALRNAELPVPSYCNEWENGVQEIQTAFVLMPTCSSEPIPGALEDLCWNILNNSISERMRDDVNDFVLKITNDYNSIGSHKHKSRLHTCLSINKDFISLKIGEAAKAGAFDWNHSALEHLKAIIEKGFE